MCSTGQTGTDSFCTVDNNLKIINEKGISVVGNVERMLSIADSRRSEELHLVLLLVNRILLEIRESLSVYDIG